MISLLLPGLPAIASHNFTFLSISCIYALSFTAIQVVSENFIKNDGISISECASTQLVLVNETYELPIFHLQIVSGMTLEQRKNLLFFWTSVKYLPVQGFKGLASKLYIYKSSSPCDHLPSSHTCFFRLCFPPYPTKSIMKSRLQIITQEHVGCSFGTW